jgi:hypothetical protein
MGNRSAKFVAALLAGIVAGAPLPAVSQSAPSAAEDCLAAPKGAAPEGQHWYYRIDRGTKRQCWYLREEGARPAQAAANSQPAASPPARSVQDAHAELTTPAPVQEMSPAPSARSATAPWPAASQRPSDAQQPALAQRWPDASSVAQAPLQAAPAPKLAEAATDAQAAPAPVAAASPAAVPLAAAEAPAEKPTGSLHTLLLVIGGALTLAGITGSLIYRVAGSRRRVLAHAAARRRANWDSFDQSIVSSRAPWVDEAQRPALRTEPPRPREFSLVTGTFEEPAVARDAVAREDRVVQPLATEPVDIDAIAQELEALAKQASAAAPWTTRPEPETEHEESMSERETATETAAQSGLESAPSPAPAPEPTEPASTTAEAEADDTIDINVITMMLERLAQEGPKLTPIAADPADFEQSRPAQSGARA